MNWVILGQCLDAVLASTLVVRLVWLHLHSRYIALLTFVLFCGLQSLIYIPFRVLRLQDYRLFYCESNLVSWCTTIWMVYALMFAILKHLPGILRFSLAFLNVTFIAWLVISMLCVRPEWAAYAGNPNLAGLYRLYVASEFLDRAFAIAEILIIASILAFVLRFPIRVPRNLAAFSAALSLYLLVQTALSLTVTYIPSSRNIPAISSLPGFVLALCLIYWIATVSPAGEVAEVTLGREWQSVPKEHLVRQLEALNAALLRSRA